MSNGGFFGGFAQGFASTYGKRRQRLADILAQKRLDLQEQHYQEQTDLAKQRLELDKQRLSITDQQAQSLDAHRKYAEGIDAKKLELAQRSNDLEITKGFIQIMDSTKSPALRKAGLRLMAQTLGVDTKNPAFKEFESAITGASEEELKGATETLTSMLPNASPGQIAYMAKEAMSDPKAGLKLFDMFLHGGKDTSGGRPIAVIKPGETEPSYVSPSDATQPGYRAVTPSYKSPTQITQETSAAEDAKFAAERVNNIIETGRTARTIKPQIDLFKAALQSGEFTTGAFAASRASIGRMAEFFGIDPVKDLGLPQDLIGNPNAADLMLSASNQLGILLADRMSRTTNMSLGFIQDSLPNLIKTPEGNAIIVELFQRTNDREIKYSRMAERMQSQGKTSAEISRAIAKNEDRNPVVDQDFIDRIKSTAQKGAGIDLSESLKEGEKIIEGGGGEKPATRTRKVGGGVGTDGKPTPVIEFPVKGLDKVEGLENQAEILTIPWGDGTKDLPVLWDEKDYKAFKSYNGEPYFMWGPTGTPRKKAQSNE